ncbi:hypothetical protein [Parasulfitobacter algicola]|uniref:Uncharacterized protein n=1 Tax=Parasulfitobacter algicola TaxID=2614809 RepID=A0ABX2IQM8_9RHOB|nr:hypothetical protein [Sulfitobacter algicola]NSX54665.1 hypothetical protein [Sulfitobacter algicola]
MRILLIFFAYFCVSVANAEVAAIRSGEHTDFSRLVIQFSDRPAWDLLQVGDNYTLSVTDTGQRFNTSVIFDKIPRTRVSNVADLKNGSIVLEVECDCYVDASNYKENSIIIDVVDSSVPKDSRILLEADDPLQTMKERLPVVFEDSETVDAKHSVSDGFKRHIEDIQAQKNKVALVQADLVKQLGMAAADGLVNVDLKQPDPAIENKENHTPDFSLPDLPLNSKGHVRFTNGAANTQRETVKLQDQPNCIQDDRLNISSWGKPDQFTFGLSQWRSRLLGEFDRPEADAYIGLIRHYLYFGLGAEARELIENIEMDFPDKAILYELAQIFEKQEFSNSNVFASQLSCNSVTALWAILAIGSEPHPDINETAILRGFNTLPLHLRQYLAPTLAENLSRNQRQDVARQILTAATRIDDVSSSQLVMAEAELEIEDGRAKQAEARLETLIGTNSHIAVDALIALINGKILRNEAVTAEQITQIAAFAFEHKGSKRGLRLSELHVKAASSAGMLDETVRALSSAERLTSDLASKAAINLATNADEMDFLSIAFSPPKQFDPSNLTISAKTAIADRLVQTGFFRQAQNWFENVAFEDMPLDAKLILAESHLGVGDFQAVILTLKDIDSPAAAKLNARAEFALGNFTTAHAGYKEVGQDDMVRVSAWNSGDWDLIEQTETQIQPEISLVASQQERLETISENQKLLEKNRMLLEQSNQTREALRVLLSSEITDE